MPDENIVIAILQYDIENFRKYLCLSPTWHYLVLSSMDQAFKQIECEFINKYYKHLLFKRSYTNTSIIYSGGRAGVRIDRVIVAEVLPEPSHRNKCMRISLAFKQHPEFVEEVYGPMRIRRRRPPNKLNQKEQCADYKMDILK